MALRDWAAIAVVVTQAACCSGSPRGGSSDEPVQGAMVKIISRGSGTLAGIEASALGFDKPGVVASDGKVALVSVLSGVVRVPLDRDDPALRLAPGTVYDAAAPISVESQPPGPGAALRVTDAAGHTVEIPGAAGGISLAPLADGGVLRVAQDGANLVVQRYARDARLAHEARVPAPSPAALPVASAAHGDVAVVVLDDGDRTQLLGLAVADGAVRWRQTAANRYTSGFAVTDRDGFAITLEDPASCEACSRAEIRRFTDGSVAHGVRLGPSWTRGRTLGVAGDALWTYLYRPAGSDHMLGVFFDAMTSYEVFSIKRDTGKPIRTLADARGEWRTLSAGAAIHALVPAPDGRVVALHVPRFDRAEAIVFSGPP